jgi:hypothetical protein
MEFLMGLSLGFGDIPLSPEPFFIRLCGKTIGLPVG